MYTDLYLSEILTGVLSAQHAAAPSVANTCLPHLPHRVKEINIL